MFSWTALPLPNTSVRGFTLIELLVVCSILAALAFTAWGGYQGVQEAAENDIALADLRRVADAVRRFKADTGHYPGQGPFLLSSTAVTEADCTASDGILREWAIRQSDIPDVWAKSPANLSLLFEMPPLCSKHPLAFLANWNPSTGRGWRGPYLEKNLRLWVDHGNDLNGSDALKSGTANTYPAPDGTGTPLAGEKIPDIPAYGSGPRFKAAGPTSLACNVDAAYSTLPGNNCMLGWRRVPRKETALPTTEYEITRHARPFLLFGTAIDGHFPQGDHPRVVYLGKDGIYGGRNVANPCQPNLTTDAGADDHVLCLAANP